jgi:hypothetical protein
VGKIYIDIPKLTMDVAYNTLRKEIDAYRKQTKHSMEELSSRKTPIVHDSVTSKILPMTEVLSDAQQSIM